MEEIAPGDIGDVVPFDSFAWPLCSAFGAIGAGWLAPQIPQPVLVAAFTSYLDLAEDETLLAILGRRVERAPGESCALTTKRIYWAGAPRLADSEWADPAHPSSVGGYPPPPRCEYLAYKDLPETIGRTGVISKVIELGEGRLIDLGGQVPLMETLVPYLGEVRARIRGEKPVPVLAPEIRAQAGRAWRSVVAAHAEAVKIQAQIRRFTRKTALASRPFVTQVLAAACVLVELAMIFRGVSPTDPDNAAMFAWGAIFGPSVVFDGEMWRLPASMFLHFGIAHLAMNMWCLLSTGPIVERFFGHFGYAALYLLSGLGGALASLCVHPISLCGGASGAIFGIIGGLLAYLVVRHQDVPAAILQPMRSGTIAFVGYNVVFGLMIPKIDMAGHLGGLATGFVVGLPLAGGWATRGDWTGLFRRSTVIAVLALGLGLLAHQATGFARGRILANPEIREKNEAAPAWNDFQKALQPLLPEFERIGREIERIVADLNRTGVPPHSGDRTLDRLITDSDTLGRRLATLPVANDEIRAISGRLASAQKHQAHILDILKRFLANGDATILSGPEGLKASGEAFTKDFEQIATMRDAYFQAHQLSLQKNERP